MTRFLWGFLFLFLLLIIIFRDLSKKFVLTKAFDKVENCFYEEGSFLFAFFNLGRKWKELHCFWFWSYFIKNGIYVSLFETWRPTNVFIPPKTLSKTDSCNQKLYREVNYIFQIFRQNQSLSLTHVHILYKKMKFFFILKILNKST